MSVNKNGGYLCQNVEQNVEQNRVWNPQRFSILFANITNTCAKKFMYLNE